MKRHCYTSYWQVGCISQAWYTSTGNVKIFWQPIKPCWDSLLIPGGGPDEGRRGRGEGGAWGCGRGWTGRPLLISEQIICIFSSSKNVLVQLWPNCQVVAVLSAMKMEMAVQAPMGGKVRISQSWSDNEKYDLIQDQKSDLMRYKNIMCVLSVLRCKAFWWSGESNTRGGRG